MKDFVFVYNPDRRKKKYGDESGASLFFNDEASNKLKLLTVENKIKKDKILVSQNWTLKNM